MAEFDFAAIHRRLGAAHAHAVAVLASGTRSRAANILAASAADVPPLLAAVERVEQMHTPRRAQVICADMDCEDPAHPPTEGYEADVCNECSDAAGAVVGVVTLWPCPTIKALRGEPSRSA